MDVYKEVIEREGNRLSQKDMKELLQMTLYSGIPHTKCIKQHSDGTTILLDELPDQRIEQMYHFIVNKLGYNTSISKNQEKTKKEDKKDKKNTISTQTKNKQSKSTQGKSTQAKSSVKTQAKKEIKTESKDKKKKTQK